MTIDEDERAAQEAVKYGERWAVRRYDNEGTAIFGTWDNDDPELDGSVDAQTEHIARYGPGRALRHVEVNRSILHLHRSEETMDKPPYLVCRHDQVAQMTGLYPCATVRYLAAIWSDHPDYRTDWDTHDQG